MEIVRKLIDWKKTGYNLQRLRNENSNLRRYVCSKLKSHTDQCRSEIRDCESCNFEDMDRNISRPELAKIFNRSESVINNWETGRSQIGIEDLLYYCQLAQVELKDILVFEK